MSDDSYVAYLPEPYQFVRLIEAGNIIISKKNFQFHVDIERDLHAEKL